MAQDVAKEAKPKKKKRTSPVRFIREVESEVRKVTWPTRNEWMVTTIMVFIMVIIAAIFFFFVDTVIGRAIQFILELGS